MNTPTQPLHGSQPPKPSLFPLLALVALGGGAYLATTWNLGDLLPIWAAPVETGAGMAACLIAFGLGCTAFKCRRTGFYAGLLVAASAPVLRVLPVGPLHLALLTVVLPALGLGWILASYSEERLGAAAAIVLRIALGASGLIVALLPIAINGESWPPEAKTIVPMGCFAVVGALIVFMSLAGRSRRWPLAEAVLVSAASLAIWSGLTVR